MEMPGNILKEKLFLCVEQSMKANQGLDAKVESQPFWNSTCILRAPFRTPTEQNSEATQRPVPGLSWSARKVTPKREFVGRGR